jgi:hypothetical protein
MTCRPMPYMSNLNAKLERQKPLRMLFFLIDELRRAAARGAPMEVGLGLGVGGGRALHGPGCCTRGLGLLVVTRRLCAVILCGL